MNIPPFRRETTLPLGLPGSALYTARAPRAVSSIIPRDWGEPISSSEAAEQREVWNYHQIF
jgi:hypothetical protein